MCDDSLPETDDDAVVVHLSSRELDDTACPGWPTPAVIDDHPLNCVRFQVPDDPLYAAAFWGAVGQLSVERNWNAPDDATAAAAATYWRGLLYNSVSPCPVEVSMLGSIVPFATASLPAGWLACDGAEHLREDYPELYAALDEWYQTDADHFITPDLGGRVVVGADGTHTPGSVGGTAAVTLDATELPAHSHDVAAHSHGLNSHTHSLNSHVHSLNAHTHPFTPTPHGHDLSDEFHTHTVNARQNASTFGTGVPALSGNGTPNATFNTLAPAAGLSIVDASATGSVGAASGNTGAATGTTGSASGNTETATAETESIGGGVPHTNMQPFLVAQYAIRAVA